MPYIFKISLWLWPYKLSPIHIPTFSVNFHLCRKKKTIKTIRRIYWFLPTKLLRPHRLLLRCCTSRESPQWGGPPDPRFRRPQRPKAGGPKKPPKRVTCETNFGGKFYTPTPLKLGKTQQNSIKGPIKTLNLRKLRKEIHILQNQNAPTLGIQSPSENGFMEPKYFAFRFGDEGQPLHHPLM